MPPGMYSQTHTSEHPEKESGSKLLIDEWQTYLREGQWDPGTEMSSQAIQMDF